VTETSDLSFSDREENMGGTGKQGKPPRKDDGKSKKLPAAMPADDEDVEDGDIATPKRDRYDEDDQPL
jgi:hypothetical protein